MFKYSINQSMLVIYATTPTSLRLSLQWFWVTSALERTLIKLGYKLKGLLVKLWLMLYQLAQVRLSFLCNINEVAAHRQRIYLSNSSTFSNLLEGPFSASSSMAKYSSFVIKVESFFSFTSFLA